MKSFFSYFFATSKFLWPVLLLLLAGLVTIYGISPPLFWKQFLVLMAGSFLVVLGWKIDWRALLNYRWLIGGFYSLTVILLLLVLRFGPLIRHARSWLVFGPFNLQPVEFAKLALILVYARFFSRRHIGIAKWKIIFDSFLFFIAPAVLVILQPNLGSALILFGIWFGFLLVSGLPRERVVAAFFIFILVGIFGWNYLLRGYQKDRIIGLLYPQKDVLGINYSSIQSKIAIGSAGLWGKGYRQGTEAELGFLTSPAEDFILAAFIEEWGIVAGILLILVFLVLIFKILNVGLKTGSNFEKFIVLGAAMVFGIQFLLNAGSTVGIFPVAGIPFPFFSYGGSSLLMNFLLLAIINTINIRQT